jgi:hypothetical protein
MEALEEEEDDVEEDALELLGDFLVIVPQYFGITSFISSISVERCSPSRAWTCLYFISIERRYRLLVTEAADLGLTVHCGDEGWKGAVDAVPPSAGLRRCNSRMLFGLLTDSSSTPYAQDDAEILVDDGSVNPGSDIGSAEPVTLCHSMLIVTSNVYCLAIISQLIVKKGS